MNGLFHLEKPKACFKQSAPKSWKQSLFLVCPLHLCPSSWKGFTKEFLQAAVRGYACGGGRTQSAGTSLYTRSPHPGSELPTHCPAGRIGGAGEGRAGRYLEGFFSFLSQQRRLRERPAFPAQPRPSGRGGRFLSVPSINSAIWSSCRLQNQGIESQEAGEEG